MVNKRDMLRKWRCRLLGAKLVDLAEGNLKPSRKKRLERHVSQCADCAAALSALREIPSLLRGTRVHDDEQLWQRQRHNIMRAIRSQPEPTRWRFPLEVRWGMGLAAATALLLAVIGYQQLRYPGAPVGKQPEDLASLDTNSVLELAELTQGVMLQNDWVFGAMPLNEAHSGEEAYVPGSGLTHLTDDELQRLSDLLGEQTIRGAG